MKRFFIVMAACAPLPALCQTNINSSTFGMMEARWLGPGTMSGRITDIEGVNNEPKTLYVGTAGGGVWKTTNSGATFKPMFDKYCQSIGDLAVDQSNPKIIYVGTGESNMRNTVSIGNGLYKSTDAGENFTKLGLDSTEHIAKIVINPKNTNEIYVAAPGPLWHDSPHRGLYKTEDGGKTWNKIFYINEKTGAADVVIDPNDPKTVYATTWEFRRKPYSFSSGGPGSGIYKSIDGGKNWRKIQSGFPQLMMGRVALTLAPSAPKNLVAIAELANDKTGLFISDDGGENWKSQSSTLNVVSRPFYFSSIVVDPKDPQRVYRPGYGFSYSSDGGKTFADASNEGGWVHSDHHALWVNPNATNELWLGTDGGVYLSLDRGATWSFKGNLPVGQFYHVALDNAKPYRIYGGLQDNGSWVAPSAAPGGVGNAVWQDIFGGDGFWVVPDGKDANIAYAESQGGNIGRVNLTTGKSIAIKPQRVSGEDDLRWNWNTPIHVGPSSNALYVGAQYVYRSTDQGRNWQRISPDLTTNDKNKQKQEESGGLSADNTSAENHCTIFTIAESPLDGNLIYAGTDDGNLQVTTDGGKSWTNLSANYAPAGIPRQTWVSSIEPSRFDKQVVYATFDNHMYGDHKSYVARSNDMGKTWKMLKGGEAMEGFAHKIKEDLVNKELLFAGTEHGLYASLTGGEDWFKMKNNIPWYSMVRDIAIHPTTHDLVVATHGRGIIVVDDISPIRALTAEMAAKDVLLMPMPPMVLGTGQFGGGGFPATGGWNGGNPPPLPTIKYYLKERQMSGDAKVEILDKDGKLVQSIPAGKRKGINMVTWNMRGTPPKVAEGSVKLDYGMFVAPMVLPGDYTIKLTVGDKTYEQPVKVLHDEKGELTIDERKSQHDAALKLFKMQEELALLVDTINKQQAVLKDNMEKLTDKKNRKLAEDHYQKLEEQRGKLMATKNKSVFADEKRLKEEISEVYVQVSGNEAAPSNLQTQRIDVLKDDLKKQSDATNNILRQYTPVLKAFEKEKIYLGPKQKLGSTGTSG